MGEELERVLGEDCTSEASQVGAHRGEVPFLPPTEVTEEPSMQSEEPEIIRIHHGPTDKEEGLINRAESLHISNTRIATTRTEQATNHVNIIDPTTGHIIADPDTATAYQAAGPD